MKKMKSLTTVWKNECSRASFIVILFFGSIEELTRQLEEEMEKQEEEGEYFGKLNIIL